jgi:GNAT superfamily N-acetyltransferase
MRLLRSNAHSEGFAFVERLAADWETGTNRFDKPGEKLLGAFLGEQLVGVGGLNREPYDPPPSRGRLRHLYVLKAFRGHGIARALVTHLLEAAEPTFNEVRLRTASADAAAFYEHLGFQRSPISTATHVRQLRRDAHHP